MVRGDCLGRGSCWVEERLTRGPSHTALLVQQPGTVHHSLLCLVPQCSHEANTCEASTHPSVLAVKCAGIYRYTCSESVCFRKMGLTECCTLISKLLFTFHNTLWKSPEATGRGLIKLCRLQIFLSWLCRHLPSLSCPPVPFQCCLSPS